MCHAVSPGVRALHQQHLLWQLQNELAPYATDSDNQDGETPICKWNAERLGTSGNVASNSNQILPGAFTLVFHLKIAGNKNIIC